MTSPLKGSAHPGHQLPLDQDSYSKEKKEDCLRSSYLETDILFIQKSPLRGFFTLFWVVMGFFLLQNMTLSLRSTGHLLGKITLRFLSKNLLELFVSDVIMMASAALVFPFQIAISNGLFLSQGRQLFFQVLMESVFIVFWSVWTYNR